MTKDELRFLGRRNVLIALGASIASPFTLAQPSRPVRVIVPNAAGAGAGAGSDLVIRVAASAMGQALGQSVVIYNQPGAGGIVGLQTLARSNPDGNTLACVANSVVMLPSTLRSVPFDILDDFTPIALIGTLPLVLVVHPKVPARNAQEFITLLKSEPGELTYGSSGTGALLHLATELFFSEAGVTARHIPYRGGSQMVADLIGGQVDFGVTGLAGAEPYIQNGSLRAIGTLTQQRTPANIPTMAEQNMPGFGVGDGIDADPVWTHLELEEYGGCECGPQRSVRCVVGARIYHGARCSI